MNEDFSEILNKFQDILKQKDINLNKLADEETSSANDSDFSIDLETILKAKDIISKINDSNNSARNRVLYSLKPYLEDSKKEKLDKYIKIANLLNVLENMDDTFTFLQNKKGYDFILIITLFLLIF